MHSEMVSTTTHFPSVSENTTLSERKANISGLRVRCTTNGYIVGNKAYSSATTALQAYIDIYDGRKKMTLLNSHTETFDLFVAKQPLGKDVNTSDHDIKWKERELRLQKLKADIEQAYLSFQSALRKSETRDALNKSKDLLQRVENDPLSSDYQSPSELGSMATDALIGYDPYAGSRRTGRSRKRPTNVSSMQKMRSKTVDCVPRPSDIVREMNDIQLNSINVLTENPVDNRFTRNDTDMLTPRSHDTITPLDHSFDRLAKKMYQIRSRSESPVSRSRMNLKGDSQAPSWVQDMDADSQAVSWANTTDPGLPPLSPKKVRGPPSWVNEIDGSDMSSVLPSTNLRGDNTTDHKPPGLSYSELTRSPSKPTNCRRNNVPVTAGDLSRYISSTQNVFDDRSGRQFLSKDDMATIRMEKRMRNSISPQKTDDSSFQDAGRLSKSVDSSLHLSDVPVPDELKGLLEKYLDPKRSVSPDRRHQNYDAIPRSGSLDTLALLSGQADHKGDFTLDASTIPRDEDRTDYGSRSDPLRSGASGVTSNLLDGDRPWEKQITSTPHKKVLDFNGDVRAHSPTFTQTQHPGSMEALKSMLFRLQQEAVTSDPNYTDENATAALQAFQLPSQYSPEKSHDIMSDMLTSDLDLPALRGYDFQAEPGGESLERALVHLSRLKSLVSLDQDAPSTH